jgi:hypothetical protein
MNGSLKNILAAIGGTVVIPATVIVLDCSYAYFTNTLDDLNNGVKTPVTKSILIFTDNGNFEITHDFKNRKS